MKFVSSRYFIKIPSEITLIYCNKKNVLLVKTATKQKLIRVNVDLLLLKEKKVILITGNLTLNNANNSKKFIKTIRGLTLSLIKRAFFDVTLVTCKKLKLIGVGYKVFEEQNKLNQKYLHFKLGYSHSIYYKLPANINIKIHQFNKLFLSGYFNYNLSKNASIIKCLKRPEPYKGKGISYSNEIIKLKEGKKV